MSDSKSLKVSPEIFGKLNQLKIRLAGSMGEIPTVGNIVNALLISADRHYDDIVDIIRDTSK